jgi:hypothetical protein
MLKKYEEAKSCFEEGLKLESDNSYLQSGLALVNNEKEIMSNQPNISMDMMHQLMQNSKIQEKVKDPAFVSKMMQYQANPLSMLQDSEMMEIFSSIMQEMGSKNTNHSDVVEIMSDDDDTEEDSDNSELDDLDDESIE